MNLIKIKEIKKMKKGEVIAGNFLLTNFTIREKGSMGVSITDTTGSIDGNYWKYKEDPIWSQKEPELNKVYYIEGKVNEFNGNAQINVEKLELNLELTSNDFLPTAPMSVEELKKEIGLYVNGIKNEIIRDIVITIIKSSDDKFFTHPAAKANHHEIYSGLAYHTLCMLELAQNIGELYNEKIYKKQIINLDLLYAGVILHDYGKVYEMLSVEEGKEYTTVGNLVGHLVICSQEIAIVARDKGYENTEEVMLLQHLVLSHHGELEYGSPKTPAFLEAELLTRIDNIDAKIYMIDKVLDNIDEGTFSQNIFSLDRRKFYRHGVK